MAFQTVSEGDRPRSIALDGPAAAGKTTVGRILAAELDMLCFDTGVLYRALTVSALSAGISVEDGPGLAALVESRPISLRPDPERPGYGRVLSSGEDISGRLRQPQVDASVSAVSRHAEVRDALLGAQRRIAAEGPVVMLGRDIGTVVLPDADIKIFLDASVEARARRRYRERLSRGEPARFDQVLARTARRDQRDASRDVAPLRPADDALIVNTDRCGVMDVARHLLALVARWPDTLTQDGGEAPCAPS